MLELLLLLLAVPPRQAAELQLGLREPIGAVSPAFLSLTLDASLARDPRFVALLRHPKLRALASGLSPGFLRFGGTSTDFLIFNPNKDSTWEEKVLSELQAKGDVCRTWPSFAVVPELLLTQWPLQEKLLLAEHSWKKHKNTTITRNTLDILHTFASCSGFRLVFGLNALLRRAGLRWDSSNARQLLGYCAQRGYNISWELGNEPNSFRKKSGIYIDGFQLGQDFIHLRQLLSQHPLYQHAELYGPDVGQPRKRTQHLLRSFLKSGGKAIDSVTWHHYYVNGRSATREDFLSPDVLDSFATAVRDVLEDYWLSLLYKRLVGTRVLEVSVERADVRRLRVYLHCTNPQHPKYREGDVTLFALNLYNVTQNLQLPKQLWSKSVDQYLLLPHGKGSILSREVQLNGRLLRMVDDETLPALHEMALAPGSTLGLPAFSYGFYVIRNAKAIACI
ncbi:heparanase isoform X4 [Numida meleagris]|uniref:heparanase isoform X4 n=1 Tax=Numida meleagris TaxID=8996 RepID=UPI000B3DBCBB|nr:heparanase isoform X4 [Numida meleagris]